MMQSSIRSISEAARKSSIALRRLTTSQKNKVLLDLALLLEKNSTEIISENAKDLAYAKEAQLSMALQDRLAVNQKSIQVMANSVREIAALPDPVGLVMEGRKLANNLSLIKKRIPIGVIGVIFESRPNVTIDIGALCFKSSNAVILRGGKEALHSNLFLNSLFRQALKENQIDPHAVQLMDQPDRELLMALLQEAGNIDLIVPRGGAGLIQFVSENSKIPVIKHDAGICHLFVDHQADLKIAADILINGKIQKPSVCNALETVIIDKRIDEKQPGASAELLKKISEHPQKPVKLFGDEVARTYWPDLGILPLTETGYSTEYLDYCISVKLVSSVSEAIDHIHRYSSGHSEAIISENIITAREFEQQLDSAAVFINCSTRFHDGGEFGYGAEVGIATGKLHCRGPMGLMDLTTSKFVIEGNGQIRT